MGDARFDRQRRIFGWNQSALKDATVVVVGMGALGNEAARLLAMIGVGRLLICDPDVVEVSNLSRTALFRERHLGCLKVEAAAESLRELAPNVEIEARPMPLVRGIGLAELREAALVLGCLDSRSARLQLAGRCNLVQAPLIDGGTHPWGGEVRLALEEGGFCYGCTLSAEERAENDEPWSCLDEMESQPEGAAAPTSALIGGWMAMAAARYLMGLEVPSGLLVLDAERGTTQRVDVSRDPDCPLHHPIATSRKIPLTVATVGELRSQLGDQASPLAWEAFLERVECTACDFAAPRFGLLDRQPPCPVCGAALRPRGNLEINVVPADVPLVALGIASREILAVHDDCSVNWIELASTSEQAS